MSGASRPRPLVEIVGLMEERWAAYVALSPLERASEDAQRWVPTAELHDIWTFFMTTGGFIDEPDWQDQTPPSVPPRHAPGFP